MVIIYDNTGKIFLQDLDNTEPAGGIQYLKIDIPEGKYVKGVDVSVTPNVPILEDYAKTDDESINKRLDALENYILLKESNEV